jgi:hypothetical protein
MTHTPLDGAARRRVRYTSTTRTLDAAVSRYHPPRPLDRGTSGRSPASRRFVTAPAAAHWLLGSTDFDSDPRQSDSLPGVASRV